MTEEHFHDANTSPFRAPLFGLYARREKGKQTKQKMQTMQTEEPSREAAGKALING